MESYQFDEVLNRVQTHSVKFDLRRMIFGTDDVLPLWVADMDFKTPDFIVEAIRRRLAHEIFGYTYVPESFFESIQAWMKKRHGWPVEREWLLCCPGVVPALVLAVLSFTEPGDPVVVQPPVYFPFFSVIRDNGRVVIDNPLVLREGRLSMDDVHLAACLEQNVKLLLLCSPHNPGGSVWTRRELERLGELCTEKGVLIVSDEIHSDLIFKGHKHVPTASVSDEVARRTVTLISPTKTFNTAGLPIATAIIPDVDLRRRFQRTMENLHLTIPNVLSVAALESAYTHGERWLEQLLDYLENNLNYTVAFFERHIPEIRVIKPEGTYLVWLDCRGLGMNHDQLQAFMVGRARVGLNDGLKFGLGGDRFLRLNMACPLSVLKEALERIEQAVRAR